MKTFHVLPSIYWYPAFTAPSLNFFSGHCTLVNKCFTPSWPKEFGLSAMTSNLKTALSSCSFLTKQKHRIGMKSDSFFEQFVSWFTNCIHRKTHPTTRLNLLWTLWKEQYCYNKYWKLNISIAFRMISGNVKPIWAIFWTSWSRKW